MLVDDQEINRRLMAKILSKDEDFSVVGEATNGVEAIENFSLLKPDVILMDMEMADEWHRGNENNSRDMSKCRHLGIFQCRR